MIQQTQIFYQQAVFATKIMNLYVLFLGLTVHDQQLCKGDNERIVMQEKLMMIYMSCVGFMYFMHAYFIQLTVTVGRDYT